MGVELGLVFCYGSKKADVFSFIDTHKMLGGCYDDLFELDGIIPESISNHVLDFDISTNGYGDIFKLYTPKTILHIINKNIDKISKKHEVQCHTGNYMSSDLEDCRVQMAIGMLERLSLMEKSSVMVGLYWS